MDVCLVILNLPIHPKCKLQLTDYYNFLLMVADKLVLQTLSTDACSNNCPELSKNLFSQYDNTVLQHIEEGLNQKTRQRSSHRIGGQNPCRASFFAVVFLKQTVELKRPSKNSQHGKDSVPNPMRRPCLQIKSFFYAST